MMDLRRKAARAAALLFASILLSGARAENAAAADAMIHFSASQTSVAAGTEFSVTMAISASENITGVDAYVSYDASVMSFISGGTGVSGGSGLLHISQPQLSPGSGSVQYSLKFKAYGNGAGVIGISDEALVKGAGGAAMSATSDRITVTVTGGVSVPETPGGAELSGDNSLLSLEPSNGSLEPEFSPDVTKYSLTVDYKTDKLYFTFEASDKMAAVEFLGNDNLFTGDNKVRVGVTAPNGEKKKYVINVKKETEQETQQRLIAEGMESDSGIDFEVYNDNGAVYIQNQYKFQIVDVDESGQVPKGYEKTSVLLYGVNVTAYTMENDLDSDYLLMYCLNESGDKEFYQFDRQDKSLQRYTGDLIDRVNADAADDESKESEAAAKYSENLRQLAIIIAVVSALCVMLVIGMASLLIRQVKNKGKGGQDADELDF